MFETSWVTDTEFDSLVHEAERLGREHGTAAAQRLGPDDLFVVPVRLAAFELWFEANAHLVWEHHYLSPWADDMTREVLFDLLGQDELMLTSVEAQMLCNLYATAHQGAWKREIRRRITERLTQ